MGLVFGFNLMRMAHRCRFRREAELGHRAPLGKVKIRLNGGQVVEVGAAGLHYPSKGDIAEFYSAGGGGYGDPNERPLEAVLDDVVAGLLSVENALKEYGVVIDSQTLAVDMRATEKARQGLSAAGEEGSVEETQT